jgi:hypothetical protein
MRRLIARLLAVLDGTPAPSHRRARQAGQSAVELALITPILITLLAGLVEIGWFANNYLTLLDVTRSGARRGATLNSEEFSPLESYNNDWSYVAIEDMPDAYRAITDNPPGLADEPGIGIHAYDTSFAFEDQRDDRREGRDCDRPNFYSAVACNMLDSLDPLQMDPRNGVDDIVVSVFSVENVDPNSLTTTYPVLGPNRPLPGYNGPQIVVVGRYPTNANECNDADPDTSLSIPAAFEPRDPFDFNENNAIDVYSETPPIPPLAAPFVYHDTFSEVFNTVFNYGYDDATFPDPDAPIERQVGFVWLGQQRIVDLATNLPTNCIGSQWRVDAMEDLFNVPGFVNPISDEERRVLPGQGIVLAEMWWQHELLLKIPVFDPVFAILGDRTTIYVWAAFPVSVADPSMVFD